ncbi:MAG: glycogen synthase [Leptospiraceae bacterium]|nr:glycogen synthase [Leptospiraceae bacterium]
MKILHTTAEFFPYIKAGGLSDMLSSLSEYQSRENEIFVALPIIGKMNQEPNFTGKEFDCIDESVAYHSDACKILKNSKFKEAIDGTRKLYFFDSPVFRNLHNIYANPHEHYHFAVFSYACYHLALELNIDLVHTHDWHTALVSVLCSTQQIKKPTCFTIHNLAYQGDHPVDMCRFLRIDPFYLDLKIFDHLKKINYMKAALSVAEEITTVSQGYRDEILTEPMGNFLSWLLKERQTSLTGILNGINEKEWNPELDQKIYKNYSVENVLEGKRINKLELYKEYGLSVDLDRPLIGLIGRLTHQKGFHTFLSSFYQKWKLPFYYFVLGSGDPQIEGALFHESHHSNGRIFFFKGFNEILARKIEAAADFFLMPSLFEPCGLNQMYSHVYGTIPIVSRVGGLKDSVIESWDKKQSTGFVFEAGEEHSLNYALDRALSLYFDQEEFHEKRKRIMKLDWSWKNGNSEYLSLYKRAIRK